MTMGVWGWNSVGGREIGLRAATTQ